MSRPLTLMGKGSPSHWGRMQASTSNSHIRMKRQWLAAAERAGIWVASFCRRGRKATCNAAVRFWAGGSILRSSQGRGSSSAAAGQAKSNMVMPQPAT